MVLKLMHSIQLHAAGIRWILMQLAKGKYILFFIPGLLISLLFWKLFGWTSNMEHQNYFEGEEGVSSFLNSTLQGSFHVFGFLLNQLQIFLLLTVLSPLFTWLSEKTDEQLTGNKAQFDIIQFVTEFFRMLGIVVISLILEGVILLIYTIISSLFNLEWLDSYVAFCVAAYFYGFAFYDYSLERYQIGIFTSLSFARQKAMLNFVTGICFSFIALIPIVGMAVAPVVATILATYVFLADHQKINTKHDNVEGNNQ